MGETRTSCGSPARTRGLLAIDRPNEVHNTISASESGVGARFIASLPEHDALVLEFIQGTVLSAELLRRGDRIALVADACRRLHGSRRFSADFDMFVIQPGYLEVVRERGFRLPDRYTRLRAAGARRSSRRCASGPSRRCRATTICSPRTSSTRAGCCGSSTTSTRATTRHRSSSATSGASRTSRSRSSRSW